MAAAGSARDALREAQLAVLLATPSEEAEAAYYARLVVPGAPGHGDVLVRRSATTHGKGLFAARDFDEGERVLVEPPLVGMQQEGNRKDALVCGECFRYVGSVEGQIARRLLDAGAEVEGIVDPAHLRRLMDGEEKLPGSEHFPMPATRACPGGSREVYCSEACEAKAMETHVRCMYGGDAAAAAAFVEHAKETNDIFILAAKLLVRVALAAERAETAAAGRHGKAPARDPGSPEAMASLAAAWEPFAMGHKAVWWEAVARPDDVAAGDEETAFRDSMKDIAVESLNLLVRSLPSAVVEAFPGLFDLEVFSRVIGMFELNNLEIAVASHVEDYFLHVDDLEDGSAEKEAAELITGPLLDALDTGYCAPCEGTGFFALQSCINSDCDPNVAPLKDDDDRDGSCVLVAKRPIRAGEELTMCYVDESADVKTRRAELADYGFTCQCARCQREEAGLGQARRGSKMK